MSEQLDSFDIFQRENPYKSPDIPTESVASAISAILVSSPENNREVILSCINQISSLVNGLNEREYILCHAYVMSKGGLVGLDEIPQSLSNFASLLSQIERTSGMDRNTLYYDALLLIRSSCKYGINLVKQTTGEDFFNAEEKEKICISVGESTITIGDFSNDKCLVSDGDKTYSLEEGNWVTVGRYSGVGYTGVKRGSLFGQKLPHAIEFPAQFETVDKKRELSRSCIRIGFFKGKIWIFDTGTTNPMQIDVHESDGTMGIASEYSPFNTQ